MAVLTVREVIEATGGKLLTENDTEGAFSGVSIDSRTILQNEIFFALRGKRFDGHDFLKEVISKGAGGAVVEKEIRFTPLEKKPHPNFLRGFRIIKVPDTLRALQDLAHFLRMRQKIPIIAITGSNGKTTTKEMSYAILSRRFKAHKNEGNLNNHIGVPLSLIKIKPEDEVAVFELGMNARGEIRRLCEILVPTHGVITNIGTAHIGRLGSLEAIRDAKLEVLDGLDTVVVNADDDFLMQGVYALRNNIYNGVKGFKGKIITFSINRDSDVKAEDVVITEKGSRFILRFSDPSGYRGKKIDVNLNVHGIFNIYNALAASAVCYSLGIPIDEIKGSLEGYTAFPMRFEVIRKNGIILINDSYNANPSSMREALNELIHFIGDPFRKGKGRAVAVLGDMAELGEFSEELHRSVGRMVGEFSIDVFIAVGEMMRHAVEEAQRAKVGSGIAIYTFRDASEAAENILNILREGDTILVKGSRLMAMEKIVERISRVEG